MKVEGASSLADMYLATRTRGHSAGGTSASHGDTVSLSSEAKRLMEHFRAMRFEKDTSDTAGSTTGDSLEDASDGLSTAESGTSEGSGTAGQVEDIRKRIKDLMDKVQQIMDGDMSPDQKQSAAAPYLQQIQQLQQQLQELMATGQKKA